MTSLQLHAVVEKDGSVILEGLPFKPGETLAITVETAPCSNAERYPLRGSVLRYDDPFEPAVPPEQWEALQ